MIGYTPVIIYLAITSFSTPYLNHTRSYTSPRKCIYNIACIRKVNVIKIYSKLFRYVIIIATDY